MRATVMYAAGVVVDLCDPSLVECTDALVRAYIDDLLPDVLEGKIEPGRVFDRIVGLDGVPDGYRTMADRDSLKVLVQP